MVPTIPGIAGTSADYRDDFGDGNFSGNDGSLDFEGPWAEFGDAGGAGSGTVHIGSEHCSNNECLHIEGYGLVAKTYGATRYADLSMFADVTLSFDIQIVPQGLTTSELVVEMFNGSKWTVVKTFDLAVAGSHHKEVDVKAHASEGSGVRFRVLDVLGVVSGVDLFYTGSATIDRVSLSGSLEASTTTTSTTRPTTTSTPRPTTTTSLPATTTTSTAASTPTSAIAGVGTSTARDFGAGTPVDAQTNPVSTTTTTAGPTTTSSGETDSANGALIGPLPPDGPSSRPPVSGLRVTAGGVIADYQQGMMGDMDMTDVEVLGVEVTADFSMAVELFETARIWIAGLTLVVAAAVIGGLDRKRAPVAERL